MLLLASSMRGSRSRDNWRGFHRNSVFDIDKDEEGFFL